MQDKLKMQVFEIANHIWGERITSRSLPAEKCSVIMNYPDPELFFPRKQKERRDKFILVYPGTLSKHQGVETAIRAMEFVRKKVPLAELHIYGAGTDEEIFQELTDTLGLSAYVHFHGLLSLEDVGRAMADADVGIEPKLGGLFSDEAFSTKIFEFMMMGVPVIASDTKIHRYYISEGLVSFFKNGNVKDLAEKICEMYENEGLRAKKIKKSESYIATQSWAVKKSEYLNVVERLMEK